MIIDGEARKLYIDFIYTLYLLELVSYDVYDSTFEVIWLSTFR